MTVPLTNSAIGRSFPVGKPSPSGAVVSTASRMFCKEPWYARRSGTSLRRGPSGGPYSGPAAENRPVGRPRWFLLLCNRKTRALAGGDHNRVAKNHGLRIIGRALGTAALCISYPSKPLNPETSCSKTLSPSSIQVRRSELRSVSVHICQECGASEKRQEWELSCSIFLHELHAGICSILALRSRVANFSISRCPTFFKMFP